MTIVELIDKLVGLDQYDCTLEQGYIYDDADYCNCYSTMDRAKGGGYVRVDDIKAVIDELRKEGISG